MFNALHAGKKIGCDVVQLFSKNQMQWQAKALSSEEIVEFQKAIKETSVVPIAIHDAYLINLASQKQGIYRKSYEAFVDELKRSEQLHVPYLIMHPGSHLGTGESEGLSKIAKSLASAFEESGAGKTTILLETTAGQGTNLGYTFEQLRIIIEESGLQENIAVCVDTCHIFTAGYDIRTVDAWEKVKKQFDEVIGLEKLKVFHLNDSKREFGSKRDRHERIGKGEIGLAGFSALLNDPDLRMIPMIMEIPGGESAYAEDLILLRSLLKY
ncbi:MAG: deoxyribonuclease IV [bacterium]|nr:MAG: deoxyribonuclease IV [bacterium]